MSLSSNGVIGSASNYTIMLRNTTGPTVYIGTGDCPDNRKTFYRDTLHRLLGITEDEERTMPLDYGVLYTGLPYRLADILSLGRQGKVCEDALDSFVEKTIVNM